MMTVIKLGLHDPGEDDNITNISCDYPGCVNVQSFDGESELIRLGWIVTKPESTDTPLYFCPSHKASLERFSDDDRKKVVDAIMQERKKYITSLIRSLPSCL